VLVYLRRSHSPWGGSHPRCTVGQFANAITSIGSGRYGHRCTRADPAANHTEQYPRSPPRLDSLTGLRFFAALVVVLTHIGFQFSRSTSVIRTESYGYTGVTFFFLLSGFVLTWSCANQPAARFLWLRFSRVWPLHIVTAVFSMTVIASLAVNDGLVGRLLQVFLLQAWSPNQQIYYGGNSVSWSLSAEMFFYLMFPLVITPIVRLRGRGIGIMLIVTLIVLAVAPGIACTPV
jgi:peptidoglycan/LPS O-acetylase OafA/YrhL